MSAKPAPKKSVIVIEDQVLFAEFLAGHCERLGLSFIGSSGNCRDGLKLALEKKPDLILLDISLPDGDGLELAEKIVAALPQVKIVAVSAHRDAWTMLQVQRVGIHGFVDKTGQRPNLLSDTIKAVMAGEIAYAPIVNESSSRMRRDPNAFIKLLSDYETKILAMIGTVKDDGEIAKALGVSPSTVQSRRRDIMKKLNIHSTPKLIRYALVHGLTRAEELSRNEDNSTKK